MKSFYKPWIIDKKNSITAINENKHHIIDVLGGGEIISIEKTNNKILQLLDRNCGIDYIWVKNKKIKGIASRVQWGHNYDTFSIRCERKSGAETEYKKRLETIGESFGPHLTMQMYCNNREENILKSMAIIKTEDLYLLMISRLDLVHESKSDNFFKYISWNNIKYFTDREILIKRAGEKLEEKLRFN